MLPTGKSSRKRILCSNSGQRKSNSEFLSWRRKDFPWVFSWLKCSLFSVLRSPQLGPPGRHFYSLIAAAAAAKSLQSCPTLWDPRDGSPPGSPVPGILQERTLEWVTISFSNAWKWKVKVKSLSCVRLIATPWTAAYQAPPSMGFARQEYWSGLPLPSLFHSLSISNLHYVKT